MPEPQTLWALLEDAAARALPLTVGDQAGSWQAVHEAALRWAGWLTAGGCPPGARVLIGLPPGTDALAAFFGTMAAGAIPMLVPDAIAHSPWYRQQAYLAALRRAVGPWGAVAHEAGDDDGRWFPVTGLPDRPASAVIRPMPADIAYLQCTSGSTGPQRAVVVRHEGILASLRDQVDHWHLEPGDTVVNWLGFHHSYSLIVGVLLPMMARAGLVLLPTAAVMDDARTLLAALSGHRAALTLGPSFLLARLVRQLAAEALPDWRLEALKVWLWGGERIEAEVIGSVESLLAPLGLRPGTVCGVYGMAEASAIAAGRPGLPGRIDRVAAGPFEEAGHAEPTPGDGYVFVPVGRPLAANTVQVWGDAGQPLTERLVGEIVVRGPGIAEGYWQDAEATRERWQDGWLRTGDLGYLADGALYLTGRAKDLIIQGGRNVFPQDIEAVVSAQPGIQPGACVAFGVYDGRLGSEVVTVAAEVSQLSPGLVEAIQAGVRQAMGLGVARILLVAPQTLPRTASGKLQRARCRDLIREGALPTLVTYPKEER